MKNRLHRYLGLTLIGIGLLMCALGLYGLTQPDEFRAQSRIKIPFLVYPGIADDSDGAREQEEEARKYYTETMRSITADSMLSNVVSQMDLASANTNQEALDTAKAIRTLRNRIEVKAVRNAPLAEINVTGQSANEAAQTANLVATTYKQWLMAKQESLHRGGVVELEKQLTIQKQKVRSGEAELQRLKVEQNLPSPEPTKAELRSNYPKIYATERHLEDERDVERLLTRKINIEKADLSYSGADFVEIVEMAMPPARPVRNKKALGLILIASGLISCIWGIKLVRDSRLADNEV